MFVVVEGMDGTGKSTVARELAERLGADALRTPDAAFGTVRPTVDATLVESPRAHTLFYVSMVHYTSDDVRRRVRAGRSVVVDRYWASTVAYDRVFRDSGLPLDALARTLATPDYTVYLDAHLEVRRARMNSRGVLSAEDARGIDPARDRALRLAYEEALTGPGVGQLLRLDVSTITAAQAVDRICADLSPRGLWSLM